MDDTLYTDVNIAIGGINFHLTAADEDSGFEVEPNYRQFLPSDGADAGGRQPRVELRVRVEQPPDTGGMDTVFDTGTNWKLLLEGDRYHMPITSSVLKPNLFKMLVIGKDMKEGEIFMVPGVKAIRKHSADGDSGNSISRYPFQFPLDEVLTLSCLSKGLGVEIHGLGVDMGGQGVVFTGVSGAGKSTLAELWKQRQGATILSDDRLILRPAQDVKAELGDMWEDDYALYGAPWHGDAGISAYGGVPLKRILFLKQAPENELVAMPLIEATTALIVRCFPTFWDAGGMDFTVDFIGRLCSAVPCYELRFRPEQAALDLATEGI